MTARRYLAGLLLLFCAACISLNAQMQSLGDGSPGPVKAQHLTARLVSSAPSIAPGGTVDAALVLTLDKGWHVYWINAGDAGEPPSITWTLPPGVTAGLMQFPIPSRLPNSTLMDFGYKDEVAFPVLITADKSLKPGPIHLDAKVTWLVCSAVCIPGKAHLGLPLTVDPAETAPDSTDSLLGRALALIPKPLPSTMRASAIGGSQAFLLTVTTGRSEHAAEFYPLEQEQIVNAAEQNVDPQPDGVRLTIQRAPELTQLPPTLRGIIKFSDTEAYEISAPITAGDVALAAAEKPATGDSTKGLTTLAAVGLAFIGGILLNLMPCVFPVLFLKGLALVQSSNRERAEIRHHGLVYALGILVSFWIIVAVLLVLRAEGAQAGWGFHLQSPVFLAVLASCIFFFALSLAGLFDIGLSLTSAGGELAQKPGYRGSFFTGVLATVVATPCTAPFMGAAIGFALVQSVWIAFAVFTALAIGLATPYLLLSFQPAWTRLLPRPGAWMETFKQITAVIFFATVIWLTYVYGSLFGASGVYRVGLLLVCFLILTVAGWVLGKWPARWSSSIAAVLIAAVALAVPLHRSKDNTLVWQPYSQQALNQART
ncbi:MAG: protein-disulfide reductase, partial [Acidobacteriaceae bacterium]|nr:protein-disulfide reductase [Acidobacteriaceae bacterium]